MQREGEVIANILVCIMGEGGPNFSHFFAYILNEGPKARGVETIVFFWE